VVLLAAPGALGGGSTPAVGIDRAAALEPPNLTANATAVLGPASWNCGQGSQTVDLFGRALNGIAPYRYLWTFGDGSAPSDAQDPVHTYYDVDRVEANLTVTDATNATAQAHVIETWGIPQDCTAPATTNWPGVALYLALVAGVVVVGVLVVRRQRTRPLP